MSRLKEFRLLTTLAILVGLILGGVLAYPMLLRWGFEQVLENAGFERVGVETLKVSLGANSRLSAHDVTLTHPFARISIGHLELEVASSSLLKASPKVTRMTVQDWQVMVSSDLRHENRSEQPSQTQILAALEALMVDFNHPVYAISKSKFTSGTLSYRDQDQDILLEVNHLTSDYKDKQLRLSLNGQLNHAPLSVNLSLNRQLSQSQLVGSGTWQAHKLDLSANMAGIAPLRDIDAKLSLVAPAAKPLLELIGAPETRDGPLDLKIQLSAENNQISSVSDIAVGALNASGQLQYDLASEDFRLDFSAAGPSLMEAGALLDFLEYQSEPFEVSGLIDKNETGLNLTNAMVSLGPGIFRASGNLPRYPSIDDWQFEVNAERFDLNFFQPLTPCDLPELDLNWRVLLTTDSEGRELATLDMVDSKGQTINAEAALGDLATLNGSEINANFQQLNTKPFEACLGFKFAKPLALNGSGKLQKQAGQWQIESLLLDSKAGQATAKNIDRHRINIEVSTDNAGDLFRLIPNWPVEMKPVATSISAILTVQPNLALTSTELVIGSSEGQVVVAEQPDGNIEIDLQLVGSDLTRLVLDAPDEGAGNPLSFEVIGKANLSSEQLMDSEVMLDFGENSLIIKSHLDLKDLSSSPALEITGRGQSLEAMFGSFVPYSLPAIPFELEFLLSQSQNQIELSQLLVQAGQNELSGKILFDVAPGLDRTRGQLRLESESSLQLTRMLGFKPTMLDVPVSLGIELNGTADQIEARISDGQVGLSDLSGEVIYQPGISPNLDIDLHSSTLHLPTFLPSLETATDDKKDAIKRGGSVLPEFEMPWAILRKFNAEFSWDSEHVILKEDQVAAANMVFTSTEGLLTSHDISWHGEQNNGVAQVEIDVSQTPANLKVELVSERIPAIWLFTGTPGTKHGDPLQFRANLVSSGENTAQIAANLEGAVLFRGGRGSINSAKLDTLFGDFLYQLSNRVFSTGDRQTRISCTGGAFYVRNGKVHMDPGIAVRTSRFDILASGDILLPGEKLNLRLSSRSRKGIGVSAANTLIPRVGVSGTLGNPQINLSAKDTAITGGAAIFSSGLSILATGIWDRIRSSVENPCDALVAKAKSDGKEYYGHLR